MMKQVSQKMQNRSEFAGIRAIFGFHSGTESNHNVSSSSKKSHNHSVANDSTTRDLNGSLKGALLVGGGGEGQLLEKDGHDIEKADHPSSQNNIIPPAKSSAALLSQSAIDIATAIRNAMFNKIGMLAESDSEGKYKVHPVAADTNIT